MWKFHRVCGKNVSLENDCTTAKRLNPTDTSDHGICFTNTPLVNGELFEIQVEELVTRWGGSFSTGVTTNIPSDLTDIYMGLKSKESWMLFGNLLYQNGECIGSYSLNTNKVQVDDKLGIMKASDSTLHFYLNGIDHGKAFSYVPEVVYGVVDVHAKCCQVSIVNQDTTTEAGAQLAIKKTQNFSLQPTDWNVQTVCDFIDSIPECAPYVEKFRSERINGAALLELDKKDLKDFFEMPLGLAVNVCSHLKKYEEKNK
ncbi:neuralized-like protein 4 isoform X2 [Mytilus galloprovincialis]|uniref:neuralized-like protein 4 isoform X2 n=1 Tax=Mytilus galloprovincialis TaxID=29158 RepID=UPI003F7CC52A